MAEITLKIIRDMLDIGVLPTITFHVQSRMNDRNITYEDIVYVLRNGEIVENYPEDYPYPSCLVLAILVNGKPLHVCCGIGEGKIFVITAYHPDNKRWDDDWKVRRKVGEN